MLTTVEASPDDETVDAILAAVVALGRPCGPHDDAARELARSFLTRPDTTVILARAGTDVAGMAALMFLPRLGHRTPEARLLDLYVAPASRRQGVARRLLAAAERESRHRGCHVLRLECGHARTEAHRLYETAGFEHRGRDYQLALGT